MDGQSVKAGLLSVRGQNASLTPYGSISGRLPGEGRWPLSKINKADAPKHPGRLCPVTAVPAFPPSNHPAFGLAFSHLWLSRADCGRLWAVIWLSIPPSLSGLPRPRHPTSASKEYIAAEAFDGQATVRKLIIDFRLLFPLLACLPSPCVAKPQPSAREGSLRGSAGGPTETVRLG
jgi:hypothetical protein